MYSFVFTVATTKACHAFVVATIIDLVMWQFKHNFVFHVRETTDNWSRFYSIQMWNNEPKVLIFLDCEKSFCCDINTQIVSTKASVTERIITTNSVKSTVFQPGQVQRLFYYASFSGENTSHLQSINSDIFCY